MKGSRTAQHGLNRSLPTEYSHVLCFSIGLDMALVTVGAVAAHSVLHVTKRWTRFSTFARRSLYFSSVLIIAVGVYLGFRDGRGWRLI